MTRGTHPSDDPGGRGGRGARRQEPERHPHSGANAPSLPRRPGTNERQAGGGTTPASSPTWTNHSFPGR